MNLICPVSGVEFVKMGYYCRICFLFYSNEDTAKKIHCSSQAHYDKLKVIYIFLLSILDVRAGLRSLCFTF